MRAMLVSVTGGTGFVGAHSVAALVRAGHRVRLLVRDESAVEHALTPLAVPSGAVDIVVGDVLDEAAVARAVRGTDAVLHAASVYSFDPRRRRDMLATNAAGTAVVLAAGRRSGVGRIVYVSSVGALFPSRAPLTADSPVGTAREPYLASKAAAERIARRYQDEGVPVAITYPAALLGPDDPKLGDQTGRLRDTLRGLMPIWPSGGFPVGDVRDTADLHALLLSGSGSGRFFGPGVYLSTRDFLRNLRSVTGRALPAVHLPARAMLPVGVLAGWLQRVWPWHVPAEYGAVYTCACAVRVAEEVPGRSVTSTFADTVAWLYRAGHISARAAGVLALRSTVDSYEG